jgi:GDP-L-fucose synthase
MKVYVAGHTGLVGKSICRIFAKRSEISLVVRSRSQLDLTDSKQVFDFLAFEKPDLVIDAAAKVGGIKANSTQPVSFLLNNIKIQNNLIEGCEISQIENLIFLGSSCVYPRNAQQPITEDSLLSGPLESTNLPYAIAKISGIKLIDAYRQQLNKPWISLMPCNLYGVGDNYDPDLGHVIPSLISKVVKAKINNEKNVVVWGSGEALREFMYVDDLAKAIDLIVSNRLYSTGLLNIGCGLEITIKELVKKIIKILKYDGELVWDRSMPDGTPRKILDSSKILSYGWKPSIDLETGLSISIEDYLKVNNIRI